MTDAEAADHWVRQLAVDWRRAPMSPENRALCAFAEKLTHNPGEMCESDLHTLREFGFSDRAIHDATQIIGYFNYINRVADALGVEPENWLHPWEKPCSTKKSPRV